MRNPRSERESKIGGTVSDSARTIVFLLERLEDALMEHTMIPNGRNGHDAVLLTSGPWWNSPAFRELTRCLDKMRLRAAHDEIGYRDANGTLCCCSRRAARWHVIAWYVQVERRTVKKWQARVDDQGRPRRGKNGKVLGELRAGLEIQRHRDARQEKADAGVAWIVGEFKKWTAADTVSERWEDRIGEPTPRREKVAA